MYLLACIDLYFFLVYTYFVVVLSMSVYIGKSKQRYDITLNNLFVARAKSRLKRIIYALS